MILFDIKLVSTFLTGARLFHGPFSKPLKSYAENVGYNDDSQNHGNSLKMLKKKKKNPGSQNSIEELLEVLS